MFCGGYFMGRGFGGSWLFGLIPILLIVGVLFLLYRLIGNHHSRGFSQSVHSSGAMGILQEKLARGEIDREEYLERKALLEE